MTEQKEIPYVYKATTKKGETAHFGEYSAAKAWAGWGSVERIPLTILTPVEKSKKTCGTCEALARTVMLDQTSHDRQKREWVGLTDEAYAKLSVETFNTRRWFVEFTRAIEAKLKELNT
jgi:hypothetical protein